MVTLERKVEQNAGICCETITYLDLLVYNEIRSILTLFGTKLKRRETPNLNTWYENMDELCPPVDELNSRFDKVCKEKGISRHDIVKVTVGGATIKGSAYPSPFIHPDLVGIPSGRGQKVALHTAIKDLGWIPSGSNPKTLLDGKAGSGGYFVSTAGGAKVEKGEGSRLLATFDQRVYNLPRHILPE